MEASVPAPDQATSRSQARRLPIGSSKPAQAASNSGLATPASPSTRRRGPARYTLIRKWPCRDRLTSTISLARCMAEDQRYASRLVRATFEFIDLQMFLRPGLGGWVGPRDDNSFINKFVPQARLRSSGIRPR